MGKKKDKKQKKRGTPETDLQQLVDRLQQENALLRARLGKIAELSRDLPAVLLVEADDEDAEYEELLHDVDDQLRDGASQGEKAPV